MHVNLSLDTTPSTCVSDGHTLYLVRAHISSCQTRLLGVQGVGCFHIGRGRLAWEPVGDTWGFLMLSEYLWKEFAVLMDKSEHIHHHMVYRHGLQNEWMCQSVWVIQVDLLGTGTWCSFLSNTVVQSDLLNKDTVSRETNSVNLMIEGMLPKNRKHHVVPTDMKSEWQVEPHKMLGVDQSPGIPLIVKGKA